jgi:hypothetical protein
MSKLEFEVGDLVQFNSADFAVILCIDEKEAKLFCFDSQCVEIFLSFGDYTKTFEHA